MAGLAEIIRQNQAEVLQRWTQHAQQAASARGLEQPELQSAMPSYLLSLATAGSALGLFQGERRTHVESHFAARVRQGFPLTAIVEEFALLGRSIAETWESGSGVEPPGHREVERLFEELHAASAAATEMFTRHMLDDEQTEKRYFRLIQRIAREALQPDAPDLRERLNNVLELVMEAMDAQTAALLLFNPATEHLEMASSVGLAGEALEQYASSLSPSSFAGQVAAHHGTTSMLDAETTELEVSDRLRQSGIHSLLGVRLPMRYKLTGIMYIGLTAKRLFSARENRRIESFGEQLTLHMDNAKLYMDLRNHIERLSSERDLREMFVSVLAHDLRGPLSTAKMSLQLLMRHPGLLDERRKLALMIDRNISRADRMIQDLLDTNRVRVGERLSLHVEECDLGTVAREVHEELVTTFGQRFVLRADELVLGFWSADELKRAIWNLATNAIKYGACDKPVTIAVKSAPHEVDVSVHNWGSPIPVDDQAQLFTAFSRTDAALAGGQKGWGLGLTLVRGCADAHGGQVAVESTEEAGTTFTLTLPLDARPFQPAPGPPSVTEH